MTQTGRTTSAFRQRLRKRLERLDLEAAARTAHRMLRDRDKNLLVADFTNTSEPLVFVFAKGERASVVKARLADLIDHTETP